MSYKITVDKEKCDGCGECVDICPDEVYVLGADGKTDPVNMDDCTGCESCIEVCPTDALTVVEE